MGGFTFEAMVAVCAGAGEETTVGGGYHIDPPIASSLIDKSLGYGTSPAPMASLFGRWRRSASTPPSA